MLHITTHSRNTKMEGINSVSTYVGANPICQKRQCVPGSICSHCFAEALCGFRKTLREALIRNTELLTSRLLDEREIPIFPTAIGRIESFGDVMNVTQARNYIRLIALNPRTDFGIWSKNAGIWKAAFDIEGRPDNCTYVWSSREVNRVDDIPEMYRNMVDHVFTVWDKREYGKFIGTPGECAGIKCRTCLKCYTKGGPFEINERLR